MRLWMTALTVCGLLVGTTHAVAQAPPLDPATVCGSGPSRWSGPGRWRRQTPPTGATIDPSQPGLWIFTKGHYSAVYSIGAEPRPLAATTFNETDEETVALYDTIIVNSGDL